jgi:hypothetical protein
MEIARQTVAAPSRPSPGRPFTRITQLGKQHISLLILVLATPLAVGTPAWATKNNGGGAKAYRCPAGSSNLQGYNACVAWCDNHNTTDNSRGKCDVQCYAYWCAAKPSTLNPVGGTSAAPIINGEPNAPPPQGGSKPVKGKGGAAPIVKGKPVQASPGTSTTPTNPILERSGDKSGKH